MKVRELYRPEVVTAHTEEDLTIAASRMEVHEIGSLAVFDGHRLVGIITERDLIRAVADARVPELTVVRDYMTPDPATVDIEADAAGAATRMADLGARHLPVTDGGAVVGMLSVRDLLPLEALEVAAGAGHERDERRIEPRPPWGAPLSRVMRTG